MEPSAECPTCKLTIQGAWNFCPNCGQTLREKPLSTSILRQLVIYLISFFLPPFGLGWAFKYLRQKETSAKIIGVISILLTIISVALLIASFKMMADYYSKMLNGLGTGTYPF